MDGKLCGVVRRILIGTVVLALMPASAHAAFLPKRTAEMAVLKHAEPLPGGRTYVRGCARHSATCVICRYTVDQAEPIAGATWLYHGIAYVRIRRGRVVVRDPMTEPYVSTPEPPDLARMWPSHSR